MVSGYFIYNANILNQWLDLKWRRFLAEGSILARLFKESCITVRGDQEGNTVIDIREEEWSLPSSVPSVKDWANGMNDQSFVRGSVIEKFQYIFALAMAKWWGKLHADETCLSADPDRLRKSKRLLKSQRFLPRPKPKPVEAKVAIEVIKTTNGYTSDNAMDVDMPPQTLVITPSPTKHGNVESRQTQVNPTEDDQTISSLNSFEQPVILDSQSSDGELEEAIVVDSPRKKRPSSEESVDTPPIKKQKSDDAPALAEEIVGNNPNSNLPLVVETQGPKKRGRKVKQNVGGDSLSTGKRAPEVRPLRSMTTRARAKQPAKALERPNQLLRLYIVIKPTVDISRCEEIKKDTPLSRLTNENGASLYVPPHLIFCENTPEYSSTLILRPTVRSAQGRSNEKNGFVSENSMDLDMPPQTLQIPESPLKTGKGATTPELISKECGEERPTPLTPVGIESRSSDGEVEGAIVVDIPRRKRKLPDSEEPTTQENLHVTKKLKPSDDIPATEQSETQAGDSTTVAGAVPHVRAIVQEIPMAAANPVSGKKRGRKPKIEANEVVSTSEATKPVTTKRMSTRARTKKGGSEADKVIVNSSTLNYT
ncbi:hypothetical protein M422DRAFT_275678 [Sphaerobolus stellatus SS14]|uniref:Uncharacterized protein n=1 Tax=Sphaerobolus stellatus (strain SS14) TaxID=990650 RepID=A0A0C9UEM8_SPHS4|nr:hypothetical protein M422DRAFT_275678 [Sphaerobolus stellatus SS14]